MDAYFLPLQESRPFLPSWKKFTAGAGEKVQQRVASETAHLEQQEQKLEQIEQQTTGQEQAQVMLLNLSSFT